MIPSQKNKVLKYECRLEPVQNSSKSVKTISQTASVRVTSPPGGGVGSDAALLLVLVAPGRGQSAPMCVICALLAMTMMTLSTSSFLDVPGHVTFTS